MVRLRLPQTLLARTLLVAALLLVANMVAVRLDARPFDAVLAQAREIRPDAERLALLQCGYRASLLGMKAGGTFDVGQGRVLVVEIARPFAFAPWRLETYAERPGGR